MADDKKEFDIEKYYKNLSRAFKGGTPVFRQRVASKITPPGQAHSPVGTARAFLKSTTNLYSSQMASYGMYSRLSRYSDYSEMESNSIITSALDIYCLAGDTIIPLLNGEKSTIKDLFEQQKEDFWVYSYDIVNNKYVPGLCKKAMKTGINQPVFKVLFDDGMFVKLTENHLVLLKNGEYKRVKDLQSGDSIRSVYTKLSVPTKKQKWMKDYEMILQDSGEWKSTHRIVAEHFEPNGKGVVHHKDFRKWNNEPTNLQFMSFDDHKDLHAKSNTDRWENNEKYREKMSGIFSAHAKKMWANEEWATWKKKYHSDYLIKMYQDHPEMKELVKHPGADNGRYVRDILNDDVLKAGIQYDEFKSFAENFDFKGRQFRNKNGKVQFLRRRLIESGYKTWKDYKRNYIPANNHKVVSVEFFGNEDVYDLEVQEYHNFAIGNNVKDSYVIVHNSDEVCTKDEHGEMIKIFSHDAKIRKILDAFFYQVLNIDFNLWPWVRNFCKYGDQFLLVDHHPNHGVLQVLPMPVNEVEREEGFDQNDPLAYRYRWTTQGNRTLDPWQVIHFRNGGNDSFMPYGCSIIESVRRTWRQVVLLEDAVMTYRIVRSPERRVFYIDVGGIDPNDVPQFIEKVKGQLKRNNTVDSTTGQLDKRYNPMSIMDDYYIPVRGDMTSTRIESLPGGQYVGDIDDLNYHRDKLFAGLKIPKSYLGYEGEVNARSTLSQEDINFARTIARLQNIVVAELNKLAIIQLYSAGYRGEELMNFELTMASPSIITEIQRLELWRTRFEVASVASSQEGAFDKRFAYKKLFKLSDEEIEEIEEGRRKDKLFDIELESIAPPAPPEGAIPPPPEGGVAAGEVPAAPGRTEEPPPEGEQPSEPEAITAGRDPNQQRIMPNDLKGKKKKRKDSNGLPGNLTQVFNFKKTALDPRDGLVQNLRVGSSPFGEGLTMGRILTENIEDTDEEMSRQQLQVRLLRHESLLHQLEGSKLEGLKGMPVRSSPAPVGAPVEPTEDQEKQEKEDELWQLAQKQDELK